MVFKNLSKISLEQRLQVSLDQADIVWPEKAKSFNEFNSKIEPGEVELIVFRKKDTLERQAKIVSFILPPVLSEDKLTKLCRIHGEKEFFEEGYSSYFQSYSGTAVGAVYFKNKFMNKTIEVEQELQLANAKIRGMDAGRKTIQFKLQPNEGRIVIVDAIERDQSYKFEYQVSCTIEDVITNVAN